MPFRDSAFGVDWDFGLADAMVGERGDVVVHEIGVRCPCVRVHPSEGSVGQPKANCKRCRGRSIFYVEPVRLVGLVTSMSANALWSSVGWVSPGDMLFSPGARARRMSNGDRITATAPMPFEGQVILRGVDSVFSPRTDDLLANEDLLYWESGYRQAVWLEDEDDNVYRAGEYVLDGRRIKWTDGCGPAVGKKYGVKYEAFFEYIVWIPPAERWDMARELGQRVMLRRSVVEVNPGMHPIIEPWAERVEGNPFQGYENPYSLYTDEPLSKPTKPQR